ncbi:hypothetical protein, partial [Streptomyces phaeoluteigriseus]
FIERPEAIDTGAIVTAGIEPERVLAAVRVVLDRARRPETPADYRIEDTAQRVVSFIHGTVPSHRRRLGLLPADA